MRPTVMIVDATADIEAVVVLVGASAGATASLTDELRRRGVRVVRIAAPATDSGPAPRGYPGCAR